MVGMCRAVCVSYDYICLKLAVLLTPQPCSGSSLQLDPAASAANENKAKERSGKIACYCTAGLHAHVLIQKLEKHPVAFSILRALPC